MRLVLSPYELSARSVAAMAALLLGSEDQGVLTLLPTPEGGTDRQAVRDAAMGAPAFVQLMEAWRWTAPLWRSGLLHNAIDGRPLLDVVREAASRLSRSPWGSALTPFLRADVFHPGHESLHAISRDLIRGGGDPAVAIPIGAALEALASERGLVMVREPLPSVVARFERRGRGPLARCTLPALVGASAEALIETRARLAPELSALRAALSRIIDLSRSSEPLSSQDALPAAAAALERAFSGALPDLRRAAFEHGRFKPALLALELGLVPADESLAAGARALELLGARGGGRGAPAGSLSAMMISGPPVARVIVRQSAFDAPV